MSSKASIESRLQQAQNYLMKAGELINEIQCEQKPNTQPKPATTTNQPKNTSSTNQTEIRNLHDGNNKIYLTAKIVETTETRVINRGGYNEKIVKDVIIADETGSIKLVLWNEQINGVEEGKTVTIENGYMSSYKGEIQLNVGQYGKITVNDGGA
jgi:replication factor A1